MLRCILSRPCALGRIAVASNRSRRQESYSLSALLCVRLLRSRRLSLTRAYAALVLEGPSSRHLPLYLYSSTTSHAAHLAPLRRVSHCARRRQPPSRRATRNSTRRPTQATTAPARFSRAWTTLRPATASQALPETAYSLKSFGPGCCSAILLETNGCTGLSRRATTTETVSRTRMVSSSGTGPAAEFGPSPTSSYQWHSVLK